VALCSRLVRLSFLAALFGPALEDQSGDETVFTFLSEFPPPCRSASSGVVLEAFLVGLRCRAFVNVESSNRGYPSGVGPTGGLSR